MPAFLLEMLWQGLLIALGTVAMVFLGLLVGRWSTETKERQDGRRAAQKSQQQPKAVEGTEAADATLAEHRCRCCGNNGDKSNSCGKRRGVKKILIAYATESNTACKLAHKLFSTLNTALQEACSAAPVAASASTEDGCGCCSNNTPARAVPEVRILQLTENGHQCSVEHLLESNEYGLVVLIASTYTNGTAPESSQTFAALLQDAYTDFRVPRDTLSKTKFAVFGLGDVAYGAEHFNRFAKNLHTWCKGLGAFFVVAPVYASEANTVTLFNLFSAAVVKWIGRVAFTPDGVVVVAKKTQRQQEHKKRLQEQREREAQASATRRLQTARDSEEEDADGGDDDDEDAASSRINRRAANGDNNDSEGDVEDIVTDDDDDDGGVAGAEAEAAGEPPVLLQPRLRASLQRQGYHLVGTHSGVKLCRWTKAMLRGRGGCYKHTFYNIASHQCMEMTPSLACANKCVFCWRHHTNPVGRSFRWRVDPPQQLVTEGIAGHQQMVKQMRGVPGVTPERLEEAMRVRHCALSLVGEPIMYPEINTFVDLLHEQDISSFMVTNAQFPEQLRDLKPVTQLYLSIDAPTPEELKRVDRPLFEDYWERCLACVRELRRKPQRTVFRLTLVNQYNTENVAAYADLVRLGWPDFIEVKGVTYCGTSTTSTLTMKENVPRHVEVVRFCEALCEALASCAVPKDKDTWLSTEAEATTAATEEAEAGDDAVATETEATTTGAEGDAAEAEAAAAEGAGSSRPYSIACEHEHSCCVLIALRRFRVNGVWHTWIDYDKFTALARSGRRDFTAAEYAAPTPSWAVFCSDEKGFDPTQVRVRRKGGNPTVVTSGC